MKLTALEVHQKEFGHSMRGYREDEVDDFLDLAASEIDRLNKENEVFLSRIRETEVKLAGLESDRSAINSALVMAQRTADELLQEAEATRDRIIAEARDAADRITHDAESNKRELLHELKRLKTEEEHFRKNYTRLLDDSLRAVSEVRLPASVIDALSDKNDSYAAALARAAEDVPEEFTPVPAAFVEPEPVAEPVERLPADEVVEAPVAEVAEVEIFAAEEELFTTDPDFAANAFGETIPEQGYQAPACAFAPEPEDESNPYLRPAPQAQPEPKVETSKPATFTQGLIMGEIGDQGPIDLEIKDPRDFVIPGGNRWGDREDDLDIEEID